MGFIHLELAGTNTAIRVATNINGYGNSFVNNTVYDSRTTALYSSFLANSHSGYRLIGNYVSKDSSASAIYMIDKNASYSNVINSNAFFGGYVQLTGGVNGLDPSDSVIGNVF